MSVDTATPPRVEVKIEDSPTSSSPSTSPPMTPSRRNKRKMTEPRRRSDAIKKICPVSEAPSDTEDDGIQVSSSHLDKMIRGINSKRSTSYTPPMLPPRKRAALYVASPPASPPPRRLVPPGGRSDGEERDSGGTGSSPSPSPEERSPTSLPPPSEERMPLNVVPIPLPLGMPLPYDPMALYARAYQQYGLQGIVPPGLPGSAVGLSPPLGSLGLHPLLQHRSAASTATTPARPTSVISSSTSRTVPHAPAVPSTSSSPSPSTSSRPRTVSPGEDEDLNSKRNRKNYKNMTRARRVEANARERSRVHTISAAFDNLRRAVPSYSYNQKLSKLAILRIACSYILALAKLADLDYTHDQSNISFDECVDLCTSTIQCEGRARRRYSQT